MTPDGNRHSEAQESEPEKLTRLLEIELMQKRAGWQQAKARRSTYRTMSFLFLFAVLIAAFLAFYLLLSSDRPAAPPGPRPAPAASP